MTVTHVLQANFAQSIGKALPVVPGLRSMVFLGSGFDGNNGNRVVGGPAPSNSGNPTFAASYLASAGYNGTVSNGLNLNVTRDATLLAAGWTWCVVARAVPVGSIGGIFMEDSGGAGPPLAGSLTGIACQGATSFNTYLHAAGAGIRATLVLSRSNAGNWHFMSCTYSGGALGNWTLSEYTDVPAGATPATYTETISLLASTNSPVCGGVVPNSPSNYTVLTDIAFAAVIQGVMLQADVAALAAAVRPWLARRGIVA